MQILKIYVKLFLMKEKILERFLRYVKVNTRSMEGSDSYPSSACQWDLLKILKKEMEEMGLTEIELDKYGYLFGTLPANVKKSVPAICFISHVDTSPEVSGENVKPIVHKNYKGGDIKLPLENQMIKYSENPELAKVKGNTIITSSGDTLLGADDKAGIAEILTAIEYLIQHPEIKHGKIRILFTPDEETGQGTKYLELNKIGAKFAYTVDGSSLGEVENETFNAAAMTLIAKGYNVHPGYAKDKMVNAIRALTHFISLLPSKKSPENTEKREGYIHPLSIQGDVSEAKVKIILRDFEWEGIEEKKNYLEKLKDIVQEIYPKTKLELQFEEQYRNMRYYLEKNPEVVNYAIEAVKRLKIKPVLKYIRGGTDGSALTLKGILTPNIFAGGQNFHSKQEWISLEWMELATKTIIEIIKIWEEKN